ncbi:MAG: T9SS type A sorting domain-containing protein [Crocinitomicaceae bacterium]|nr:T9SS type A sorting domain-containing protein [Crocinitomicaceae bacterium]
MKRVLLAATIFCGSLSFSQSLTQANEPSIGDSQTMYLCDSFAATYQNLTGTGITWDYSNLFKYDGVTRAVTIEDATLHANAGDFGTSSTVIVVENTLSTFFNSTATERVSQGFVFNEPSFGDVIAKFNVDEETIVTYPFSHGSSLTDTFEGTLDFTLNGIPQSETATGNAYAWIDGQGTLLMPDGSSIADVIRYKLIDTSLTNIFLFGDLEVVRTQYEYYDLATSNLPVLTISKIVIQTPGGGIPLTEVSIVLSAIEPTATAGIENNDAVIFNAYPNPTEDKITINGAFNGSATATILDHSGRVISTQSAYHGKTIDLSTLNTGMYLLKITNNGASSTKTIVKK